MHYLYDSKTHFKEQGRSTKILMRIFASSLLLTVVINFWKGFESWDWSFAILNIVYLITGVLILFELDKKLPVWPNKSKRLSVDGDTLRWKFGKEEHSLNLNEIRSYRKSSGEVIFITADNIELVLPTHEIENRSKWEEFMDYIRNRCSP